MLNSKLFNKILFLGTLTCSLSAFATSELGIGVGFNPEGREEATGDSFFYFGYSAALSEKFDVGAKLQFRNYGAPLSSTSQYQDRDIELLARVRYFASDRFYLGTQLGPRLKIRSTIELASGYSKTHETFFEMPYIPKPVLGLRLWINQEQGSAVDASIALSNKGKDVLCSLGVQF